MFELYNWINNMISTIRRNETESDTLCENQRVTEPSSLVSAAKKNEVLFF